MPGMMWINRVASVRDKFADFLIEVFGDNARTNKRNPVFQRLLNGVVNFLLFGRAGVDVIRVAAITPIAVEDHAEIDYQRAVSFERVSQRPAPDVILAGVRHTVIAKWDTAARFLLDSRMNFSPHVDLALTDGYCPLGRRM